jgi:polysaccharide biosynthesis/export protein
MTARGRSKIVVALATVLGMALGNTGCQNAPAPTSPLASLTSGSDHPGPAVVRMAADPTPGLTTQVAISSPITTSKCEGMGTLSAIQGPPGAGDSYPQTSGCCLGTPTATGVSGSGPVPTELNRVSLPPYTIAPPDILFIDTLRLVPRPPYRLEPLETLLIKVTDTLPGQPIEAPYTVSPEGTVNLGFSYGTVQVAGLSLDQAQAAIRAHLCNICRNPQVVTALAQFRGIQQTRGEHLVRPDGTVSLGTYGCVYVAGLTVSQAKCEIEKHLSKYFLNPQVAVDVFAYNSKVYYVVFDGGGYGMQVLPFPITGNETVLDAIARVSGLAPVSSVHRIWVARPSPVGHCCDQVLPVDWLAIVKGGSTTSNYQLFPGDRVYVDADCLIKVDNWVAKIFAPVERLLGVTLLGTTTVQTIRDFNNNHAAVFVP